MPKIMGLDVGEKTVGVAFTDETCTLVSPGETLLRHEGYRRDMAALRGLVSEHGVRRIVVGLPHLPDGSRGPQAARIEAFVERLRSSVRIPIEYQDEAYTTAEAQSILDALGRPRDIHKRTIDSVAACLILQDYLAGQLHAATPDTAIETDTAG